MNSLVNKRFLVAGLPRSGKTTLILALMERAKMLGETPGAMKPFDVGQLRRNAQEAASDGQLFQGCMQGNPAETLVSPYMAHEVYPVELAFRRDGITLNWQYLHERLTIMAKHYQPLFVELPGSMMTPLDEATTTLAWAQRLNSPLIYALRPEAELLASQMAEVALLKAHKLEFHLWINNQQSPQDGDFLFYFWEKMEALAEQQIEGMLPFAPEITAEERAQSLGKHLAGLLAKIDGD